MKPIILNTINQNLTPQARDILSEIGTVVDGPNSQSQLVSFLQNVSYVFTGLGFQFDRLTLESAHQLKVIATATTGLDHINVEYAKEKRIEVLSLRGEEEFLNTITGTAELSLALLLDLSRFLPWAKEHVESYKWDREQFRGHSLYGKILGIVGLGRLGKLMARYGQALGMTIIATDPYLDEDIFHQLNVQKVDFETLVSQSDVISIHVHLNQETENMFNTLVFERIKSSAVIINTARGKIVNENDLLTALKNGQIGAYGSDVLADENSFGKEFQKHPLIEYAKTHKNIIITPHIGGMTFESREATDIFMAKKLKIYIEKNEK